MTHSKYSHFALFTNNDEFTEIQFVITPGQIDEIQSLIEAGINALSDENDCVRQVLVHTLINLDEYLEHKRNLGVARPLAYDGTNPTMEEIRIRVANDYTSVQDKSEIYADFDGSLFE